MSLDVLFYVALPIVAFLYASVGHGGASAYLALLAMSSMPISIMKPTALILNLFVAGVSFLSFTRKGYFNFSLLWPFILGSMPMAFWAGGMTLDPTWYKRVLGILLVFAVVRMRYVGKDSQKKKQRFKPVLALFFGAIIGFLSGAIGIGGGIILSPIVLLFSWADVKESAALSAAFIWLNSFAALLGYSKQGLALGTGSEVLIFLAFVGGSLGAYFGAGRIRAMALRNILALVLALAAIKLIFVP